MSKIASASAISCLNLFLLIVISCSATESRDNYCPPSSCGHINISYPFRLETDPSNCGSPGYELVCVNNRAVLNFTDFGIWYYVEAITYDNYSIRVVDPGLNHHNCSSYPIYSFPWYYKEYQYYVSFGKNVPIIYVDCLVPVHSPSYIEVATFCGDDNNTDVSSIPNTSLPSSLQRRHSYVAFGDNLRISELKDSCGIRAVALASQDTIRSRLNASFSDIHRELAYGFELSWFRGTTTCIECDREYCHCYLDEINAITSCECYNPFKQKNIKLHAYNAEITLFIWSVLNAGGYIGKRVGIFLATRNSLGILCLIIYVVYKGRKHSSIYENIENFLESNIDLAPIRYGYWDIRKMTNAFKEKLGEGGFGTVFKGKLRSGSFVAVKMMTKVKSNGQDFISEVATIGRIHHVNVVRLIGFFARGSKRALVYEFMSNGSLEKYIFPREEGTTSLTCKKMFEISLGVARGIEYLHQGCDMQILHFDIKPHNILLDENFTPKVSDFGLAKLYPTDESIVSLTAARGTMGYMAPELFYKNIGGVSYKADVYSFGMLLMEMAGRRKNLNALAHHTSQIYFPSWAYDQLSVGMEIKYEATTEEESKMVKKMIIVAFWCIQFKPCDRPSMSKVVEMLEGDIEHVQMPPKPFLSPRDMPADDDPVTSIDQAE